MDFVTLTAQEVHALRFLLGYLDERPSYYVMDWDGADEPGPLGSALKKLGIE